MFFGTRQRGLEYSPSAIAAATKFCRSLVSSVNILQPRRARSSRFEAFVLFVVVIDAMVNQFRNDNHEPATQSGPPCLCASVRPWICLTEAPKHGGIRISRRPAFTFGTRAISRFEGIGVLVGATLPRTYCNPHTLTELHGFSSLSVSSNKYQ
jgi:hypothetical protein